MINKEILKLRKLRKKIDDIDKKILKLLIKRFIIVEMIKSIKKRFKIKIKDKKRENEILKKANNSSKKYGKYLKNIYKTIIRSSLELQK